MAPELVLGIDAGTTGCKALVFDGQGNVISAGREPIPLANPQPQWFEQTAEDWRAAFVGAVRQAAAGIDATKLAALCIAHQRETFVPVAPDGAPLGPAIVWMDERARSLLPELLEIVGDKRFQQITGKPLSGNLTVSKIAWLQRNQPELSARVGKFLDVQAYLVHYLTGSYRTSSGSAGPTGLFDLEGGRWSEEILAGLGLQRNHFPETVPPGEVLGALSVAAAQACDLPHGLPVVAGIGDGQAAGIGANITRPEDAYLSLGTSVIGGYLSEQYRVNHAFRTMIGAVPSTYFLETVLLGGAYTIQWFMERFLAEARIPQEFNKTEWFERAAQELPAGSDGLLCVPYWNSVMNPYWDASASGIVIGWRGHHTPHHFYRAILEGIAFELCLHKQGVEQATNREVRRYLTAGGGARSDLWCQIIADVNGVDVQRTKHRETTAIGAGILAAVGAGIFENSAEAAREMTTLEPHVFEADDEQHARYRELFEGVYIRLYPALRDSSWQLADLIGS